MARLPKYPDPKAPMRIQRLPDYVWCDEHGAVHEDSTAPYGSGAECERVNHRPLLIRAPLGEFADKEGR